MEVFEELLILPNFGVQLCQFLLYCEHPSFLFVTY
jgi:hypothetical protein